MKPGVMGWQEPRGVRAHYAMEALRQRWYVPVGSGLAISLPFLAGFLIYSHELELPFRPAP